MADYRFRRLNDGDWVMFSGSTARGALSCLSIDFPVGETPVLVLRAPQAEWQKLIDDVEDMFPDIHPQLRSMQRLPFNDAHRAWLELVSERSRD